MQVIAGRYAINGFVGRDVASWTRDRASVNGAAIRIMGVAPYPNAADMNCLSHFLNGTGEHFATPHADEWLQLFTAVFTNSTAALFSLRAVVPAARVSYSRTRWMSAFDVLVGRNGRMRMALDTIIGWANHQPPHPFAVETLDALRSWVAVPTNVEQLKVGGGSSSNRSG